MTIDLNTYFNRIAYQGVRECTSQSLVAIHRQQCWHIPFDMLDPHLGIPPSLDPDYLFEKLVNHKRGGGCSQINELLALVLSEMGFKVERLMARVLYELPKDKIPTLAHKTLLVECGNQKWLCDTGFGSNSLIEPIPFVLDQVFHQFNAAFMLVKDENYGFKLITEFEKNWVDLYAFNLSTYFPEDFNAMHFYNCCNADMLFVKHAIVTMPFAQGRKILKDRTYKERTPNGTNTIEIASVEQYHQLLKQKFNIELPDNPSFFPGGTL
jgi:N-hydroxyarylamine O-acetyltransferase